MKPQKAQESEARLVVWVGLALASITGSNAAKACAIGGAAGAVVGYMEGRKKDLQLAEQIRERIMNESRGTDTQVILSKRQ